MRSGFNTLSAAQEEAGPLNWLIPNNLGQRWKVEPRGLRSEGSVQVHLAEASLRAFSELRDILLSRSRGHALISPGSEPHSAQGISNQGR